MTVRRENRMATPIETACPNCSTMLRVPEEFAGKKVKCKKCETVFPVPKPLPPEFAKPGKAMPAKPVAPKLAAPPPGDAPLKFAKEEDDDANPYTAIKESDAPRCPHCAKDMDPPDAMICLHCGYDLRERRRKESRAVVEHTFFDYVLHHLGAVFLVLLIGGMMTGSVICWLNMADWLQGSFLETGEKDPTTQKPEFYVKPWCFSLWIFLIALWLSWICAKFCFRRFFIDYRPAEKLIKKSDD